MARISRLFTYDLADDYLAQTNTLKKSGTWTYQGPDRIWVFLNTETNKLDSTIFYTLEEDGPNIPSPLGCTKLEIDCNSNPLFCTLIGASDHVDGGALPQYSEVLPNGELYTRPMDPMPDHTYDFNNATYDPTTNQWSYPWKETWVTWDDIRSIVQTQLSEVEVELRKLSDLPSSMRTRLEAYKTELENFETTWAGIDAYKVWRPVHPFGR
jgi:hypothetical protein